MGMTIKDSQTKIVIVSVPWCETIPLVAPALLSSCLQNAGIGAAGIDLSIKFTNEFHNKSYWENLKIFLAHGYINDNFSYRRSIIDVFKFIKREISAIQKQFDPEYIGLSIFTTESVNFSYFIIYILRKYFPKIKIIIGGRGLESFCGVENTPYYKKFYSHGLSDSIVIGDAETAIIEVIKNNISGLYFAKTQSQQDLDSIPAPDWNHYDFSVYHALGEKFIPPDSQTLETFNPHAITLTSSKGCVRNCSFCDVASFWPKFVFRDGENVARDIIVTYQKTGIREFQFTDNLINGSVPNYRKMNQILADTIPQQINYSGYAIFRGKTSMPEDDFTLAAKAGCRHWGVGIESGSEKVRYDMRKKFNNDDMDFGVKQLYKNNIQQTWMFVVGYPSETDEDFVETLNLIKRYSSFNSNKSIYLSVTAPFQLNDNTPLMQEDNYVSKYNWSWGEKEVDYSYRRYFWVTPSNPDNTFITRYNRWKKIIKVAEECQYPWHARHVFQMNTYLKELEKLKEIYEQFNKKVIFINKVK